MKRTTLILCVLLGTALTGCHGEHRHKQTVSEGNLIVPGTRVGHWVFDMSKDEVVAKLGPPRAAFYGNDRYTLDTLPDQYYLVFEDIAFRFSHDRVQEITTSSARYKLASGLSVGSSEKKVKQALGRDFDLQTTEVKDMLTYRRQGLKFEIHKTTRIVMEINVTPL